MYMNKEYELQKLRETLHEISETYMYTNDMAKLLEIQYLVDKILTFKGTNIEDLEMKYMFHKF